MSEKTTLTVREAAAHYGWSESTMSRMVRRLGLTTRVNPADRRSRLIDRGELDRALATSLPPAGSDELRALYRIALERADARRKSLAGRDFLPIEEALDIIRGERMDALEEAIFASADDDLR